MSHSPSIAQFFKAQRKRPRSSTGKDEGVLLSASKKLLLEEGILPKARGKAGEKLVMATEKKKTENSTPSSSSLSASLPEGIKDADVDLTVTLPPPSPVKFLKVASLSPAKRRQQHQHQQTQKKQLTTEQVAKLLKKKTNLRDLKSALEGINQCAEKITEFRRTVAEANAKASPVKATTATGSPTRKKITASTPTRRNASAVKSISPAAFYSPSAAQRDQELLGRLSATKVGSPSKLVGLNSKVKKRLFGGEEEKGSSSEGEIAPAAVPAYQRFHNLAQKTPAEGGESVETEVNLALPFHFRLLKELFIAVETVITIMKGRKEMITFPKVKAGVLELVRKVSLREKHLAQMLTVLPGCYNLGLEKVGKETHIKITVDGEQCLPSSICARRKAFHANLLKICEEEHGKFLTEKLVPPIIIPEGKQITRWHPRFKIDELKDIVPVEGVLPVKPVAEKTSTARDVIAKAQNILENANPRMKEALKKMLKEEEDSKSKEGEKNEGGGVGGDGGKKATSTSSTPPTLKGLKGVSQSLLEKIRNREREKLLKEMTRSPAESKKLLMIKRMPNYVKIIRNLMVAEKKVALPLEVVVDRVSHSLQSAAKSDTESHIRFLVTILPNWITVIKLSHSDIEYIKIDKATDINDLLEEINDIIKKHSS